jgi:Ca2+-binding RTX toxin-like protein
MAIAKIKGTTGNDTLLGTSKDEILVGLEGNDKLFGMGGTDKLQGDEGNDTLDGGRGKDIMLGGLGSDTYLVDNKGDVVHEKAGEGIDQIISTVSFSLDGNIENLVLAGNADIDGTGNSLDNDLTGNAGKNILDGHQGADHMAGGGGSDTYYIDSTGDQIVEKAGGGTDTVYSAISMTLGSNVENIILTGTDNHNATGNDLTNVLTGNDGSNILDGGAGLDWMKGGNGDDTYLVDNSGDKITENLNHGTDSVTSSANYVLSANIENLTLIGSAISGTGNDLANTITGNASNNKLYADAAIGNSLGGSDVLHGGAGNDTLYSGDGSNTLDGGDGTGDIADYSNFTQSVTVNFDTFTATVTKTDASTDTLSNIEGVRGSSAADTFNVSYAGSFYGGAGDDSMSDSNNGDGIHANFYGEVGNDTLIAGVDGGKLDGGADDDILIANASTFKVDMTGGTGVDQFEIAVNTNGSGGSAADGTMAAKQQINDFQDGVDHIVLAAFGSVDTAAEWYSLLTSANEVTHESDGIHLNADHAHELVITGLTLATFSADDILVI